jgi:UDP:flavonoid glycosyltransferase YjiC (YdhE family)
MGTLKSPRGQSTAWAPQGLLGLAEHCDAAITNGNFATCTAMLLAGKPLVSVPPFLEQWLFAAAVERLGAGITANINDARRILEATHQVLNEPRYAAAARKFADRHRDHRPDEAASRIVDDLEVILAECPA